MEDLSLHILDIVENSIAAGAHFVTITVIEDGDNDILSIEISDDGKGMPPALRDRAADPFFTTKEARRIGLGLSLLKQAVEMANGTFSIGSEKGEGTRVKATFQHSHIDRKPLGDITETIEILVIGNPDIDFYFEMKSTERAKGTQQGNHYHRISLDTKKMKKQLGEASISSSQGIAMLRKHLRRTEGIEVSGP